jgi:transcriptional regulator with XRE-family HTH domain
VASIGELIQSKRKASHLSQQALAEKCGVSRGAVQQWENGATAPSRAHQAAVAKALGITVAELMGGSEPAPPPKGFKDKRVMSDSDWALFEDLKMGLTSAEVQAAREKAAELRRNYEEHIESIKRGKR